MKVSVTELNRQYRSEVSPPSCGQYHVIPSKYVVEYQVMQSIGLVFLRVQVQTSEEENNWRAVEREFCENDEDIALSVYRDLTSGEEAIEDFLDEYARDFKELF